VLRRKCRGRKRGPEAENRQGGAPRGARPDRKGRRAPRRVPGPLRYCGPAGCRSTRAPVGAPPPLKSGWPDAGPGRTRRGNERCCGWKWNEDCEQEG
jgi:hypothetical protein